MSVYRKFSKNDVVQSLVWAKPKIAVIYGVNGWRGNAGGPSGSISLYGGIRGRSDVKSGDFPTSGISVYPLDPLDTHSIECIRSIHSTLTVSIK